MGDIICFSGRCAASWAADHLLYAASPDIEPRDVVSRQGISALLAAMAASGKKAARRRIISVDAPQAPHQISGG